MQATEGAEVTQRGAEKNFLEALCVTSAVLCEAESIGRRSNNLRFLYPRLSHQLPRLALNQRQQVGPPAFLTRTDNLIAEF